ncbi:hypothetical protein HPP92_005288 [Vanilla planifolia]|uniref:Nephrocystin-3 n=1 Tax=Vanilla planifolia TaxID=51239 RepID=A0A835VCH3_VANPL|nr:hypothetical protein HPP92_005288 [Vanilla planifolia]
MVCSLLCFYSAPSSFPRMIQVSVSNYFVLPQCGRRFVNLYPSLLSCTRRKRWENSYHIKKKKTHFYYRAVTMKGNDRDLDTSTPDMEELEKQLQELFIKVKTMILSGKKEDAICILNANYENVKELLDDGFKGIEQAAILDVLALGYMLIGDCSMVEHLLQLLKEIISGVEDEQPLLDSILVHMGSMYSGLGKFDDASLAYDRCLQIFEKMFGNQSPFLITPLMGRAKIFRLIGRATKSRATYCQVIQILEKSKGFESEQLVIPLVSLGNLCIVKGRILSIYIKLYGEKDGRVGIAMSSLAHAKCAKGELDEAINLFKRGLQIVNESKYLNLDDYLVEKMRVDLAELLHVAGREHEGRDVLKECFLICENSKGIEHPNAVGHLINLATSYFRSKDFAEAERLLRTGLQIMSKDPKDQSVLMLHLAVTLYHLRQDEEAEKLALEVVQVREESFERNLYPLVKPLIAWYRFKPD